jgi:hypothetical protein
MTLVRRIAPARRAGEEPPTPAMSSCHDADAANAAIAKARRSANPLHRRSCEHEGREVGDRHGLRIVRPRKRDAVARASGPPLEPSTAAGGLRPCRRRQPPPPDRRARRPRPSAAGRTREPERRRSRPEQPRTGRVETVGGRRAHPGGRAEPGPAPGTGLDDEDRDRPDRDRHAIAGERLASAAFQRSIACSAPGWSTVVGRSGACQAAGSLIATLEGVPDDLVLAAAPTTVWVAIGED